MFRHFVEYARSIHSGDLNDRLDRIRVGDSDVAGPDEFGFDPEQLKYYFPLMLLVYKNWFRASVRGVSNLPDKGPTLIIANHSGQLPIDGMLLATAAVIEMENPRLARSIVDTWVPTLPFVGTVMQRTGQIVGVWENAEKLLRNGELLIIFPEGVRGSGKTWDKRYRLQEFAVGFIELAISFGAKIIPTAVIGGEEQMPNLYNAAGLAKLLKAPYFPITPTFPLFGLKGAIPYPVKYRIYFGEPMDFSAYKDDLPRTDKIAAHVETVKSTIQTMIDEKLKDRPFPGL